uniref:Zinc finger PHD-type domain-containing protein n=1 Tax=Candidozyma auris TaxID=498019 RepID=A0A0L0NUT4_CANAR
MSLVVLSSESLYSTFIATVDHVPCDIVRSLWLVQACNLAVKKEEEKIHQLFLKHGNQTQQFGADEFNKLRRILDNLSRESTEEMAALYSQLRSHVLILKDEILQLQKVAETPATKDDSSAELLRKQLEDHYRQNPLPSRTRGAPSKSSKKRSDEPSGIKLILKLSKQDEPRVIRKRGRPRKEETPTTRDSPIDTSDLKIMKKPSPRVVIKPPIAQKSKVMRQKSSDVPDFMPIAAIQQEPEERYCFCNQPSFGDMIACDNDKCPNGEWFHYKCVGLLNRVEALKYTTQRWYCSAECREAGQAAMERKKKQKKKKRKNW